MKKIDTTNWKEFKVGDLFDAERGTVKNLQQLETGNIPVIAAARSNQGVAGLYNVTASYENKITISCNGVGCGSSFYHDYPFNVNGDAIVLLEKIEMTHKAKQYLACLLDVVFTRKYSYSEKCSPQKAKKEIIKLPATADNQPDWDYLEEYMQQIEQKVNVHLDYLKCM